MSIYQTPRHGPSTPTGDADSLLHVLTNVMGQPRDSPLQRALGEASYDDIQEVLEMSSADIDRLTYSQYEDPDDDDNTDILVNDLPASKKNLLRIFQAFICSRCSTPEHPRPAWTDIVRSEFDHCRVAEHQPPTAHVASPYRVATPRHSTPGPSTSSTLPTKAATFRKQIKISKNDYSEFKNQKQWDKFYHSTLATTRTHGTDNVLDPACVPPSLRRTKPPLKNTKSSCAPCSRRTSRLTWGNSM